MLNATRYLVLSVITLVFLLGSLQLASAQSPKYSLMIDVGVSVTCENNSTPRLESLIEKELDNLGDARRVTTDPDFVFRVKCVDVENGYGEITGIAYSYLITSSPSVGFYASIIEKQDELTAGVFRADMSNVFHYHADGIGVVASNDEELIAETVVSAFEGAVMAGRRETMRNALDAISNP